MNIAIILAGGSGRRFGGDIPKQFLKVNNKPILAYTIDIFENNPNIDLIEIVSNKDWINETKSIIDKYKYQKVKYICNGGNTFLLSVMNGIYNLKDIANSEDIVCVSFGCSPLTLDDDINDSIAVAKKYGNGISSKDIELCTCLKKNEICSEENVIRENLKGFANPWSFKFGEIYSLYKRAENENILNVIEQHTTSLYFRFNKTIYFSKSISPQVKITTENDLEFFKYMLERKKQ